MPSNLNGNRIDRNALALKSLDCLQKVFLILKLVRMYFDTTETIDDCLHALMYCD